MVRKTFLYGLVLFKVQIALPFVIQLRVLIHFYLCAVLIPDKIFNLLKISLSLPIESSLKYFRQYPNGGIVLNQNKPCPILYLMKPKQPLIRKVNPLMIILIILFYKVTPLINLNLWHSIQITQLQMHIGVDNKPQLIQIPQRTLCICRQYLMLTVHFYNHTFTLYL